MRRMRRKITDLRTCIDSNDTVSTGANGFYGGVVRHWRLVRYNRISPVFEWAQRIDGYWTVEAVCWNATIYQLHPESFVCSLIDSFGKPVRSLSLVG